MHVSHKNIWYIISSIHKFITDDIRKYIGMIINDDKGDDILCNKSNLKLACGPIRSIRVESRLIESGCQSNINLTPTQPPLNPYHQLNSMIPYSCRVEFSTPIFEVKRIMHLFGQHKLKILHSTNEKKLLGWYVHAVYNGIRKHLLIVLRGLVRNRQLVYLQSYLYYSYYYYHLNTCPATRICYLSSITIRSRNLCRLQRKREREGERGKKHERMKTRHSLKMKVTGKGHPQDEFHASDVAITRTVDSFSTCFPPKQKDILSFTYFSKYMYFHTIPAKQPDIVSSEMKVPLKCSKPLLVSGSCLLFFHWNCLFNLSFDTYRHQCCRGVH